MMKTRPLTVSETSDLRKQGCTSDNWSGVTVRNGFSTERIRDVHFRGQVVIGSMDGGDPGDSDGAGMPGIFNSTIDNCEICDRVRIDRVGILRNYRVMDEAVIENVDEISVSRKCSFGNGVYVAVLNEAGGREMPIFDRLTAQLAYMMVFYRHDRLLQEVLGKQIQDYVQSKYSEKGTIGTGAKIRNSRILRDMWIGNVAMISGITLLENGSLMSNTLAPVEVGEGVIARDFIVQSGSGIHSGAILERCFVGQGVKIGKQFSGENSLFFANSEAFHGEAVSIFAGPFTVTHHKSNLLIAGMFSFFNAGSGTNQSNHMYKLGPVHQGIVERGSKTGSFAYLLWPTRVGPFTVVMGKNMSHFDAGDLPFSYITVDRDRSFVIPGVNLANSGTWRDYEKWQSRDRRVDPEKFDLIRFDLLSPYIIGKLIRGLDILSELSEKKSREQDSVLYRGIRVKRLMLQSACRYYEQALSVFTGEQLVKRLEGIGEQDNIETIRRKLGRGAGGTGRRDLLTERWIDMAGMIAPESAINDLVAGIREDKYGEMEEIRSALEEIHHSYDRYAWEFTILLLSHRYDIDVEKIGTGELTQCISRWESDAIRLNRMILNDAAREFDSNYRIGYGIDGDDGVAEEDFIAVRGIQEENSFILEIRQKIGEIERKAAGLKDILKLL